MFWNSEYTLEAINKELESPLGEPVTILAVKFSDGTFIKDAWHLVAMLPDSKLVYKTVVRAAKKLDYTFLLEDPDYVAQPDDVTIFVTAPEQQKRFVLTNNPKTEIQPTQTRWAHLPKKEDLCWTPAS